MSHLSHPYLIDTHCHLNFREFSGEIPEVLARAKEAGVLKVVCVGTGSKSNKQALELADKYANVWATAGLHPSDAESDIENSLAVLDQQIKLDRVVALGEIGLDFFRRDDRERQMELFRALMDKSIGWGKPVVIHCRDAWSEIFSILEDYRGKIRGVLHCFTGGAEEAKKVVDLGLFVGFTGLITYKNNDHILEALEWLPMDRILVETDSPYLAPIPVRGQVNEPANVRYTAEKIAEVKKLSFEEVARVTSENARSLFEI